jgi:hypothetical protein
MVDQVTLEGFGDVITATMRKSKSVVADATSNHNAWAARIKKKGLIRTEAGGTVIDCPIMYQGPGVYQRYFGADPLNISYQQSHTHARYEWKQAVVHITSNGRELSINRGTSKIFNLAKSKINAAKAQAANGFNQDLLSAGLLDNQITGIQAAITTDGLGTVGGISSTAETWWRSVVQSAAAPLQGGGAIVPGPTTIESLMGPLYRRLTIGASSPDFIVFSEDYYNFFELSQVSLKRYTNTDSADAGFVNLKYHNADVFHESAVSGIPTSTGYFLTSDYVELVVAEGRNWEQSDGKAPVHQDTVVVPLYFMGNMAYSDRRRNGTMKA